MERGGIFKDLGINNFLEGDFFGWYIEIWDDLVDKGIRRVVSELANYSLVTLDADPDQTRDLLKKLYQNVMPKQLRHDLGEYYTPDWLAERLLNQLGFTSEHEPKLQEKRLLDPACGSGTFLVLAIKRVKEHSADRPIKPADLLHKILNNITGFDLNPLAVISARTNYLLALGDLLEAPRDFEVNIPVYLCDSILTPSQAEEKIGDQYRMREAEERLYKFKTVVGEFAVPGSLVKAQYIDQLAGLVEECVEGKYSLQDFRKRVLHSFPLVETTDNIEIRVLEQLYTKIKDLDERAINGIWARIIKNAFAPLFCGRFDYIAGNPPWVNWEHLPDDYREQTSAMWSRFNLFAPLESKSRLHSERSKVDISVLMLCSSMNDYLSTSGVLGFVITQTVFKAEAARGFRRFTLPDNKPFAILHVDDMITLQPFDGANNRTTVVLAHKNQITSYPIPYTYWKKIQPRTTLSSDMTLDQVISITKRTQWIAQPVDPRDPLAPWLTGRPKAVRSLGSCIGQSPYYDIVREGSNTRGANGVFWIKKVASRPDDLCVIINQADIGKNKKIDAQQGAVEQELLRPLLRGQDIQRWAAIPEIEILLPYSDDGKLIAPNVLKEKYPKTYAFLGRFESLLRSRSHFRNFNPATGIFYEMYNVGNYTMCPYKVVWREVSDTIQASVVPQGLDQNRIIVPDHTVVAIGLDDIKEAHFICALVNSSISNYIVQAYISLHPSPHVMKYIGVPLFDKQNKIHLELASLSEEAHLATSDCNMAGVVDLETRIDDITARLWNIAPDELREIRESLAELK